jgi:hypothetical protein
MMLILLFDRHCEELTPLRGHQSGKNIVIPAQAGIQIPPLLALFSGCRPAPA